MCIKTYVYTYMQINLHTQYYLSIYIGICIYSNINSIHFLRPAKKTPSTVPRPQPPPLVDGLLAPGAA